MFINKVISYNSGWETFAGRISAHDEIVDAISRIDKDLLLDPEYTRPPYIHKNRKQEITPFSFHRCWEKLMEELGWGSYRMRSDTPGGINVYVRNLKHRVASKMMATDRMMMFPNWVLVEIPRIINADLCDISVLVVPMESERVIYDDPRRMVPHFTFERSLAQLNDLLPLNQSDPFVIIGISSEQSAIEVTEFVPHDSSNTIERVLEFPKEHYQAGIGILSYFGEIIKQKYPNIDAKVRIEQDGNIVRMTINTPDGTKETIEKTLEEYTLVVTNNAPPESLLEDKLQIHALKNKLSIAELEVRQARDLLQISEMHHSSRVRTLEEDVGFLRQQIGGQMRHIETSQALLAQQSMKEERLILAQIDNSKRTVEDLVQDAWNSAELRNAIQNINTILKKGATDEDEREAKNALKTIRDTAPDTFEDLAEAVKNTMYGVSGNIVFQWLQQVANILV